MSRIVRHGNRNGDGKGIRVASMVADKSGSQGRVGITFTTARLSNPYSRDVAALEIELLVDTGAIYSVIPADVLSQLGIAPLEEETFGLADGTKRTYPVGEAFFELGTKRATSKVVFGPAGVTPLLGALTLESMGLMVNPVTRELLPMRLFLASAATRRAVDQFESRRSSCIPESRAASLSKV